tara:strand:- start:56 stop:394 length:339 start_codon:yes stop_codon:yes gene_type:complete
VIAHQVQAKIKMIAAANGTSVESVFDGSIEHAAEIVLENKVSVVFESCSPKPWEIYHESTPGSFTDVGSYDSPDKCFFALSQKLMQLESNHVSTQQHDDQKSFIDMNELTPH